MKSELSAMDLYFLTREFQSLVGAKIDKVFEQKDNLKDFLFVFHKSGSGKAMLRIKLPGLVYLTDSKPIFPDTPPGFCMFLRKHLTNARIIEIKQHGFDRILEIVFENKQQKHDVSESEKQQFPRDGKKTLVCELFSPGNMLLIDENQKIKGLLESQNWGVRTIRGGTKYNYPPSQLDTPKITREEFERIITTSQMESIVKSFAIELSLGGLYAEELCIRAGINKDKKRLNPIELDSAFINLKRMFVEKISAHSSGLEILPFKTAHTIEQEFETFSTAIDKSLTEKMQSKTEEKEDKAAKTKQNKISVVIEKQKERLVELEQGIELNQKKGELIYQNYSQLKELLENINLDRKKMNWDEIKKKYKDVEIDDKKGTVTVDLNS